MPKFQKTTKVRYFVPGYWERVPNSYQQIHHAGHFYEGDLWANVRGMKYQDASFWEKPYLVFTIAQPKDLVFSTNGWFVFEGGKYKVKALDRLDARIHGDVKLYVEYDPNDQDITGDEE